MRHEFSIDQYQKSTGCSDKSVRYLLTHDTWQKECIGKTSEEVRYGISPIWTIEVPETPTDVCELIIKNGGCSNLPTVWCFNCPLSDYSCIDDVKSAKKWIKRHSYVEEARRWVAENNIKKGDKVRVSKNWGWGEKGSRLSCCDGLLGAYGKFLELAVSGSIIMQTDNGLTYHVPYFALEVIEPYKQYETFEKWMVGTELKYEGDIVRIVGTPVMSEISPFISILLRGYYCFTITLEQAFKECTRIDGTPFGVETWEE